MAGILKVDQVQSDSNLAFAIAGSNVAFMNATSLQMVGSNVSLAGTNVITSGKVVASGMPAGSVVQVVTANNSGGSGTATTSTTYVNTGLLNLIITPKLASSKFVVSFHGFIMHINPNADNFGGSVMIYNSVNGGANTALTTSSLSVEGMYTNNQYTDSWNDRTGNITMVDTPTYTLGQSILYQLWYKKSTRGAGAWYSHHTGGLAAYAGNTLISGEVTEYAT